MKSKCNAVSLCTTKRYFSRKLDFTLLRAIEAAPEHYRGNIARRGLPDIDIAKITELARLRKDLASQLNGMNNQRKRFVGLNEESLRLKQTISSTSSQLNEIDEALYEVLNQVPNEISKETPQENEVVESIGPEISVWNQSVNHVEIGKRLNVFKSASSATGSQFYYLVDTGAQLELALINYAIHKALSGGFRFIKPPDMVRRDIIDGAGFKPKSGLAESYSILGHDLVMVATAEISLLGFFADSLVSPQKVVAWSHCFRPECGHHGAESRGLYRVHQFTKAELFSVCMPEDSSSVLREFIDLQREILKDLGLSARLVRMGSRELGASASCKYDWEAWFPARQNGSWGEVTSASNCTDFQAKRLNIRVAGCKRIAHTVNATALAVPRIIQALIECYYDEASNELKLPKVLSEFM